MAMWVQPSADSQADKVINSRVVVMKVLTSVFTLPPTMWRTQATTDLLMHIQTCAMRV